MTKAATHEQASVNARSLHGIAVGLGATLLVIALSMYWLATALLRDGGNARATTDPAAIAGSPGSAGEQESTSPNLDSYEWLNESAGIARIPIQRAMQLLSDSSAMALREQAGSSP